jgi:asparagine synthetase B (glutamine-hydrolysing)
VVAGSETRIDSTGKYVERRRWMLPPEPGKDGEKPALWSALVEECQRIIRGRRVAILLSGGLDSSSVAAAASAAARHAGWPLPVLASIVYPGLACDETSWQESVARHLGLERVTVNPLGLDVWRPAQRVIQQRLTPMADTQSGAIAKLVEAINARGCDSLLTGFGGDVLFRGVGLELSLAQRGRLMAIHRHFRGLSSAMPVSVSRLWYGGIIRPLLLGRRSEALASDQVARAGSSVRSIVAHALGSTAFGWIMEGVEQAATGRPLTLESPFYGPGFLAAYAGVAQADFVDSRSHKGILREMIRPHLPADVVDRTRKSNFLAYHRTWLERERAEMAARYRELRPIAPGDWDLPPDIQDTLEASSDRRGFSRSWMTLAVLELLNAAR